MKIIYAIIRDADSESVIGAMVDNGHSVTRLASTGGFLRRGNVTLMIGLEPNKVAETVALIKSLCSPVEPNQHSATVFVLDMPVYTKI